MKNFASLIRTPFVQFLQTDYGSLSQTKNDKLTNIFSSIQAGFRKTKKYFKNSPYIPLIVVIVLVVIIAGFTIKGVLTKSQGIVASQTDSRVSLNKPLATQALNKDFYFALSDDKGKEVSKFKYTIESAELRNEIVVKGQKATAIKGRTFLIIILKITNTHNQNIKINSKDYIRLSANSSSEKLAPDIHSDPVEVQAISTKYTRVGLAINDNDRNLTLQVGEIDSEKETIELNLK